MMLDYSNCYHMYVKSANETIEIKMSYAYLSAVYDKLTFNVEYEKRGEYIHSLLVSAGCDSGILIDLACGTGTLSRELKKYGYEMILADSSPEMLSIAREKLPDELILCQNMTELNLFGTVNCAVCSLDSINHLLTPEEVKTAFSRISLFVEKEGVFVFDVNTPYKHEKVLGDNTFVYEKDNIYCVWRNLYKRKTGTVDIDIDIFIEKNGVYSRQTETFAERAYDIEDIGNWLNEAGFEVKHVYDDMTQKEPNEQSDRVYFVAVKK